jgi:HD-GYP domain-containing protein (c-di-GMP phosphodiesterase class II)
MALAVADAYDAMTSDRPYRPAMTSEAACAELEKGKGKQFDPVIVDTFLSLPKKI